MHMAFVLFRIDFGRGTNPMDGSSMLGGATGIQSQSLLEVEVGGTLTLSQAPAFLGNLGVHSQVLQVQYPGPQQLQGWCPL